jgi:hypothetical protein
VEKDPFLSGDHCSNDSSWLEDFLWERARRAQVAVGNMVTW